MHQMIRGALACRIRTARRERVSFLEAHIRRRAAIDFVGADLHKEGHRRFTRSLEQRVNSQYVRAQERRGIVDAAVNVRLRGEVDDRIEAASQYALYRPRLRNVAVYECVLPMFIDSAQVLGITAVRQPVEIHHLVLRAIAQNAPNEVRADEAAAACDQISHQCILMSQSYGTSLLNASTRNSSGSL